MLTFSNGVKLYMTGGTSTTKQMAEMADMEIDYAFYRCDGVYNMGLKEAARCAEPVEANTTSRITTPPPTGARCSTGIWPSNSTPPTA